MTSSGDLESPSRKPRAPVRHFGYYDNWKKEPLNCACGWSGTFEQGAVEYFNELMDCECPKCFTMLATVTYPTVDEIRANEPPESFMSVSAAATQARQKEFDAHCLRSPEQLPEISDREFELEWDFEDRQGEKWTVIRKGEQEICRELAFWEGAWRYFEIAGILIRKYEKRLLDLRPTAQSLLYLLGDKSGAYSAVTGYRKDHFPRPRL
jgi:hypothetical protein